MEERKKHSKKNNSKKNYHAPPIYFSINIS